MSVQYDFNPGLDPSGFASITAAQLLQMVSQLAPLENIGGVIVMSGASSAHPDVTNNNRFTKYIWLDTQTAGSVLLKIYQGTPYSDTYADWSTVAIADSSITAAKLADYAVSILNGSGAAKIAYKQNATADATKSNYLLRLDAAGQYVEIVAASTVVNGVTLDIMKLNVSTASNLDVLSYDSSLGYAVWKAVSIVSAIADNSLAYSKLLTGTAGYLLRMNPTTGIPEQVINNDLTATGNLFAVRSLRIGVLDVTGATLHDLIKFDGTNWVKFTPYYNNAGAALSAAVSGNVAHGLGAVPRMFKAMVKYNGAGFAGYVADDIVDISAFLGSTGAPGLCLTADATNLSYTQASVTLLEIRHKTTGAITAGITEADWNWVFYATL